MKPLARLGVVVVAIASAIWLEPASVAIAVWRASGPSRVAYLSPLSNLWLALAAAAGVVGGAAYLWHATGRSIADFARIVAPLSILLLWVVPFVPWIADRAPTLLVFAGPIRWAVACTAVGGMVAAARREAPHRLPAAGAISARSAFRLDRRLAFAVAFLVYAAMGIRYAQQAGFNGDEPHYLVIAHSLLADGDLDISNNHERRDYAGFFPGPLRPDFLRRGRHGEIYSIHAPGLPAVLVPAYAVAGAPGAVVFIALIAAIASVAVLNLAERVAGPGAALLTWAVVGFSVPFAPYAWLIYPEAPAALIVAYAIGWLWDSPGSVGRTALHGLLLALLPWLHTKFVIFLVLFTLFEVVRLWPRVRHVVALLAPISVLSGLWLLSFYWMYGVLDPQAPYGTSSRTLMLAENVPRGLLGLLFDQKFGLLVYSPLYILAVPGTWLLVRDTKYRLPAAAAIATTVIFVLSTTRFYMWWGGSSAPGRFLVPIVPLLAPFVAVAVARLDGLFGRALIMITVAITIGVSLVATGSQGERLLYSNPHGLSALLGAIRGAAPLDVMLPTFTEENWVTPLGLLLPWVAGSAIACGIVVALVRLRVVRTSYWLAVTASVLFVACSGVAASRLKPEARAAAARSGQLALLRAYDPSRFHAVDVSRAARLVNDALRALTTVDLPLAAAEASGGPAPIELPEGKYEARVWLGSAETRVGEIQIVTPQDAVIASATGLLANPTLVVLDIPVTAPIAVRLTGPAPVTTVQRAEISAIAVVPYSSRIVDRTFAVEPIGGGPVRGLLAYAEDRSYPEGGVYWTRGTERSTTVVASTNAAGLKLILHVGPTGGAVEVTAGAKRFDVDLRPNETRTLTVELGGEASRTIVSVRADRSFVPSAYDKNNSDGRSLGCQVRPVLF